jgi:hypothetical protein
MTKWPSRLTDTDKKEQLKRWIKELSEVSESILPTSESEAIRKEGLFGLVEHLKKKLKALEL